ncbi:MAG: ABC transporter ATP-binding protein [Vicinamibacterales bacterium]
MNGLKIKGLGSAERSRGARPAPGSTPGEKNGKKKISKGAIDEARSLVWTHRKRLSLGLGLMVVNRLAGLVLPTTSKYLMDNVVLQHQWNLLPRLAMAAGAATLVESVTSFSLSQVLGVAAQRAITEMRKDVEAHVMRLPIRYFDSTKTGVLISRIMTDAEGIRNLVGTGLVQLTGSILTAILVLIVLIYLNWKLTAVTILVLGAFGGGMAAAFKRLRPLFRERGQINARGHGPPRRDAQRRPDREGVHRGEARGARLRARRAPPVPQRRPVADRRVERLGLLHRRPRRDRHLDDAGRRQLHPRGADDDR